MTTSIRPEISRRNAYHISRHRYYELKHFCLQYREWGKAEARNKELVKAACVEADPSIASWIFRAVTEGGLVYVPQDGAVHAMQQVDVLRQIPEVLLASRYSSTKRLGEHT